MEKISGILPESPRIRAEKETLRPVRPGAPAFGRAEGSSDIRDRVTLSSVKNIGVQDMSPSYKLTKDQKHAKMVEEMTRNFFTGQAPRAPDSEAKEPISMALYPVENEDQSSPGDSFDN